MKSYRLLTEDEVLQLKSQSCLAQDWKKIQVADGFRTEYVQYVRFSGDIRLGIFNNEFSLPGGIKKHAGLCDVTLHNVTVDDNCCIENVHNYIANYEIGKYSFIENVDSILTEGGTTFGNGVEVAVLNEAGGREVAINDKLSSQLAYIIALYRYRPVLINRLKEIIATYSQVQASEVGKIGNYVSIVNTGNIKNVRIGDYSTLSGVSRLQNGSINSNKLAPAYIGDGVIGEDFIISSGSHVVDGAILNRCFVGQACKLGHNYSASDSLFFANCQGENGEACAIFAGPFTVTHHKSTLLIAGMFSFMNAGSGSNQSNHMYKLGPVHQGILERGSKTASDSYILWPAKVGAFSLVMGHHVSNADTSDFPFSYLVDQNGTGYLIPGANLRSAGTVRDAQKWLKRDERKDEHKLDSINYKLLTPYTVQKMFRGLQILNELKSQSDIDHSEVYIYQNINIKQSSLNNGIRYYETAIRKFLGSVLVEKLTDNHFSNNEDIRNILKPDTKNGMGEWVDVSGLIVPKNILDKLLDDIESGRIDSLDAINDRFAAMHRDYTTYEWSWTYNKILEYYNLTGNITVKDIIYMVQTWKDSVTELDRMIYEDAKKEFSSSSMIGFGIDGNNDELKQDFEQVRGNFDAHPFVAAVLQHIEEKTNLADKLIDRLKPLA